MYDEKRDCVLTDPAAQAPTRELYDFLSRLGGKSILSGQQEFPGNRNNWEELTYIEKVSGQLPAILGLDYIGNDFKEVNERAALWH